jgi:hypothetical protein
MYTLSHVKLPLMLNFLLTCFFEIVNSHELHADIGSFIYNTS